jgi:L-alanine-DL-glutamate epimerase-like enolase superfamily enzyme
MRIARIESFTRRQVGVVRVRTDDGAEGWGQLSPYNADIAAEVLHRQLAPHALGAEPGDVPALVERLMERTYKFPGTYVCRAMSGLDTALWDLLARRQDKSVCELLGGRPRDIPVYGSSMRRDITPADEADRLKRLHDAKGFRAFKVRVGSVCGHDEDPWPGRTEELLRTVRAELGDEVALLADGNSCYTPARAIEVGRRMEQCGFCHFEEPCPYWELDWTAEVARTLDVPVAGGEQDNQMAVWKRMMELPAVDIVQPDVCYIGGLSRALAVARLAAAKGLPCVPHSANVSMVSVFTLHMLAAIPNAGDYMEFSIEPCRWAERLYEPALEVRDGAVAVPDGPGWGVRVRDEWLETADHRLSEAE